MARQDAAWQRARYRRILATETPEEKRIRLDKKSAHARARKARAIAEGDVAWLEKKKKRERARRERIYANESEADREIRLRLQRQYDRAYRCGDAERMRYASYLINQWRRRREYYFVEKG